MGGFTPPVATAASVGTTPRLVPDMDSAESLIRDVDADVEFERPNDTVLTVLTKTISKPRTVGNRYFEWFFIPEYPKDLSVATAATAAATQIVLATGYSFLHRGMQLQNQRTGEVFTVGGSAEPSSTTIDIIGRANAQAMEVGDALRIIGTAMEENAEKPAIRTQVEQKFYNFTQIHYRTWGASKRAQNSDSYIGKELVTERRKKMYEFNLEIEESAINGIRYQGATSGYTNSSELTYSGGAAEFVKSNVWNLGGHEPTESQVWDYLGYLMQYGATGYGTQTGEVRKLALMGRAWLSIFESFAKQKIEYDNITDAKRRVGIKLGFLQSTIGDLALKLHPLFERPGMRDKMLVLDLPQLKYVHHKGGETTIMENIQTPGATRREDGVIADCGWQFSGDERGHGWAVGAPLGTSA